MTLRFTIFIPIVTGLFAQVAESGAATPGRPISATPAATDHVILFVLEGVDRQSLKTGPMPALSRLAKAGAATWSAGTVTSSSRLPAMASLLTGLPVEKHGITWDTFEFSRGYPRPPTFFDYLDISGGRDSAIFFMDESLYQLAKPEPYTDYQVCGPLKPECSPDRLVSYIRQYQAVEFFDHLHLGRGVRLFPDDAELLLLAGAEREAMATPLFQAFARSVRRGVMVAGIDSEEAELAAAASYYRRALAADPGKVEARVRLGRVLGLRGRYAEAVEELRRAMAAPIDPTYQYFVLLFLGDGLEGMGDQTEALDAFEQAATLVPWARAPYFAIARLSRERGNRARTLSSLERDQAAGILRGLEPSHEQISAFITVGLTYA